MQTAIKVIVAILGCLTCAVTLLIGVLKYQVNQEPKTKENVNIALQNNLIDKDLRVSLQRQWARDQAIPYFLFAVTPLTILGIAFVFLGRGLAGGVVLLVSTIGPPVLFYPWLSLGADLKKHGGDLDLSAGFGVLAGIMGMNFIAGIISFFVTPKDPDEEDDRPRRRDEEDMDEEDDRPRRRRRDEDEADDAPRSRRQPRDEEEAPPPRPRRRPREEPEEEDDRPRRRPRPEQDEDEPPRRRRPRDDDFDDEDEPPRRRRR